MNIIGKDESKTKEKWHSTDSYAEICAGNEAM